MARTKTNTKDDTNTYNIMTQQTFRKHIFKSKHINTNKYSIYFCIHVFGIIIISLEQLTQRMINMQRTRAVFSKCGFHHYCQSQPQSFLF